MGEMMPDSLDRWHQFLTVRMSPYGTSETFKQRGSMSASVPFSDINARRTHVAE